jgi:hypothetical protein
MKKNVSQKHPSFTDGRHVVYVFRVGKGGGRGRSECDSQIYNKKVICAISQSFWKNSIDVFRDFKCASPFYYFVVISSTEEKVKQSLEAHIYF